jgi:hypothetical protein
MASDVGVPSKSSVTPAKAAKEAKAPSHPIPLTAEPVAAEKRSLPAPLSNGLIAEAAPTLPKKAISKTSSSKVAKAKVAPKAEKPVKATAPSSTRTVPPVDAIRGVAEQSLAQARTAFAKSQEATNQLAKGFEASSAVVQSGLKELQMRMSEAVEAQTHAAFNYFRAVTKAHTLSDLIDLQSTELRLGVQRTLGEAKEMSSLAQAIAAKATEPVRKAIDHAVETARHSH